MLVHIGRYNRLGSSWTGSDTCVSGQIKKKAILTHSTMFSSPILITHPAIREGACSTCSSCYMCASCTIESASSTRGKGLEDIGTSGISQALELIVTGLAFT